jgi:intracellular sulfur oxidation DsrE/DsrF family protein
MLSLSREGYVYLLARLTTVFCGLLVSMPILAAGASDNKGLSIDVPVVLKEAKIVFNLDHLAFEGDEPTGLRFLQEMTERFRADRTNSQIVAIFHGAAGYMLLNDPAYNRVRNWEQGNPYKDQIAALIQGGVEIEECGETMLDNHWRNADLLPGVKVNSGANFRIVQLVQQGFVQLQP